MAGGGSVPYSNPKGTPTGPGKGIGCSLERGDHLRKGIRDGIRGDDHNGKPRYPKAQVGEPTWLQLGIHFFVSEIKRR